MSPRTLRIAVSAADPRGLDAPVSPHFGRCAAFTLVEVEDGRVTGHRVVPNPYAAHHAPGDVPRYLASLGAQVVLSGGMGCRALDLFAAEGIEASLGHPGTAREAVEGYVATGRLSSEPCGGHEGRGGCSHTHHGPSSP